MSHSRIVNTIEATNKYLLHNSETQIKMKLTGFNGFLYSIICSVQSI